MALFMVWMAVFFFCKNKISLKGCFILNNGKRSVQFLFNPDLLISLWISSLDILQRSDLFFAYHTAGYVWCCRFCIEYVLILLELHGEHTGQLLLSWTIEHLIGYWIGSSLRNVGPTATTILLYIWTVNPWNSLCSTSLSLSQRHFDQPSCAQTSDPQSIIFNYSSHCDKKKKEINALVGNIKKIARVSP